MSLLRILRGEWRVIVRFFAGLFGIGCFAAMFAFVFAAEMAATEAEFHDALSATAAMALSTLVFVTAFALTDK